MTEVLGRSGADAPSGFRASHGAPSGLHPPGFNPLSREPAAKALPQNRRCDWCGEKVASGYIHETCVRKEMAAILGPNPPPITVKKHNPLADLSPDLLRRFVQDGATDAEIARSYGVDPSSVRQRRLKFGIERAA